jgi:hypothetical protein
MSTVYSEPFSRYDGIRVSSSGGGGGSGLIVVNSPLLYSSVVGSTNLALFAPDLASAAKGDAIYNATDGNSYIYNGTAWVYLSPTYFNNLDKTALVGPTTLLEFDEPINGYYLIKKEAGTVSYNRIPLEAPNLRATCLPNGVATLETNLRPGVTVIDI